MKIARDFDVNKTGLLRIFAHMDTQSAIVAALVISLSTLLASLFLNVCHYVYWVAHFTQFRIPIAYIEEAITPDNGITYLAILCLPLLLFLWWLLCECKTLVLRLHHHLVDKQTHKRAKPLPLKTIRFIKWLLGGFLLLVFTAGLLLLFNWSQFHGKYAALVIYAEVMIFVLWTTCKAIFGAQFSLTTKRYYTVRTLAALFAVYLLLGGIYCVAGQETINTNLRQNLQIVCDTDIDYHSLHDQDAVDVQTVLFETESCYYVADATLSYSNGGFQMQIWGTDSYRFIDKVNCPIKTIYTSVSYIGNRDNPPVLNNLFAIYLITSVICVAVFAALLSIPMKREDETPSREAAIEQEP